MPVSPGAVTRSCRERNEQVHYVAEKFTLLFQMFKKVIQSSLLPSFCLKFFHRSLSSVTFELIQIFFIKMRSSSHRPVLTSTAADGCHGNEQSWYPVSSKLSSYLLED